MPKMLHCEHDAAEWDRLFSLIPEYKRDVHFTSDYARAQMQDGQPGSCYLLDFGNFIQPVRIIPIPGTSYFDMKSLYGFGGPIDIVQAPVMDRMEMWARNHGIVTEYCVLHPWIMGHQLEMLRMIEVPPIIGKKVVVIDLMNEIRPQFHRRIKRAVDAATNHDLLYDWKEFPAGFETLYNKSMDRLKAEARWHLPYRYWVAHAGSQLGAKFHFIRTSDGKQRRGLLTIGRGDVAYAHFLGSDGELYDWGIDALLYFKAAEELKRVGFKYFHLGGGLNGNDKLFDYKAGFSDLHWSVCTYKRVFMPEIYETLLEVKKSKEHREHGRESTQQWFPEYRREFA